MNEEKEPKYFVWEDGKAAIYRGAPVTGTGSAIDRFSFKKLLEPEEQHLTLDELIERYPNS